MSRIITLTTDFGIEDAYVASIKGVILNINPSAIIVDTSHNIKPHNILEGAFVLGTAWSFFPKGTIHVVIVDPGVGTKRKAILLATPSAYFLAPDNGVLSYVLEDIDPKIKRAQAKAPELALKLYKRRLATELEAYFLSNPRYWRHPVSSTFHGRDIFAPVAAHLSLGATPPEFGEKTSQVLAFSLPQPHLEEDGTLKGHVLHVDRFGNLISNIRAKSLPQGKLIIEIAGRRISGLSTSYESGGELLALIGSSGYLEIAAKEKSAASLLGVNPGDALKVRTLNLYEKSSPLRSII